MISNGPTTPVTADDDSFGDERHQIRQRANLEVWFRVAFPTNEPASIQPYCSKAGRLCPSNVCRKAVTHMPYVLPFNRELVEGYAKNGRIGFRDAHFA